MSLATNKILIAGANANSTGAYFQAGTQAVLANATATLAAGTYYVYPTANVVIQVNNSTYGNAFSNVFAANAGGLVITDGINVKLSNFSNTNATVSYVVVNGGEAADSTYA